MTTNALLRRYVSDQSEPAFAELVRQHIDLVYSAALRQLNGDASAAQDVTQAVFTDLARKAPALAHHTSLTGWLYTSTRYLATKARRAEQRRRAHEQEAHAMNQLLQSADPDPAWLELRPLLDDVMHELNATDREAVLMRYFERLPLAEVGARLQLTENAARMRVDRALDKLRVALAKRGVTSTVSVLAGVLAERAVAFAPAELATRVSQAAIATVAAGCGLGWGLLELAGLLKDKLLVAAGAAAVVIGLLVVPHLLNRNNRTTTPASVRLAREQASDFVASAATPPANAVDPASVNSVTTGNKLVLHIIAADTGEPIPMATINFLLVEEGRQGTRMQLSSTSLGVCEVPVPRDTTGLFLQSGIDGFADTSLEWNMNLGETIPEQYLLRLDRAMPIGGLVVDADGKAVAGADVYVLTGLDRRLATRPESHSLGLSEKAVSDAAGRWHIERFAKEAISKLGLRATHPDYFADPGHSYRSDFGPTEAEKQLLAGKYIFKLARSVALHGIVVDTNGLPVTPVKVTLKNPEAGPGSHVTNQIDGTFTMAGCRAGTNLLSLEAKGFALTNLEVDLEPQSAPLYLTLQPGKYLRLRVLDRNGLPVPKATVSLYRTTLSRTFSAVHTVDENLLFNQQSDADGRVVWDSSPDDYLRFTIAAAGMQTTHARVKPDEEEHVITLAPALTISGSVRDAATDQPIPHFRMIIGSVSGLTNAFWGRSLDFKDAKFRYVEEKEGGGTGKRRALMFRFEAEGYAPIVTRVVGPDESEVQLDIVMQATASTVVTVVLPDGRSATNAGIGVLIPGTQMSMNPDGLLRAIGAERRNVLSTDDEGRFALPPTEAGARVIAVHPDGYAEATLAALATEPTMRLQPWGRLDGTLFLSGGKVATGWVLRLNSIGRGSLMLYGPDRVVTDVNGHFVFPKVPPGQLKLLKWPRTIPASAPITIAEVVIRSGETTTVRVGAYTVTTRLRWPADRQGETNWQVRAYYREAQSPSPHSFTETAGGALVADDVPAGSYTVKVSAFQPSTNGGPSLIQFQAEVPFTVPADPITGTLDIGEIVLQPSSRSPGVSP